MNSLPQRENPVETRLLVTSGRTTSKDISLCQYPVIVGRHRDCQLRVTSRLVSRRHCLLDNQDGWLAVEDLGSSNGTIVNGNKISSRTIVRPGDSLEIGPIAFEIHYDAPVGNGTSHPQNGVLGTASSSEETSLTGQTLGRETAAGLPKISNNLMESDRLSDLADTHFLETPLGLDSVDASEGEEAVLRAFERAPESDSEKLDDLSWLSDSE